MNKSTEQKPKKRNGCFWVFGAILLIIIGYMIIKYLSDIHNFNEGEAAFANGECKSASNYYDKTQKGISLLKMGIDDDLITTKLTECKAYLQAKDEFKAGNYLYSFKEIIAFETNYPQNELNSYAIQFINQILSEVDINKLIDISICDNLPRDYVKDSFIPEFLYQCSLLYLQKDLEHSAYTSSWEIVTNFPTNQRFHSVLINLPKFNSACQDYKFVSYQLAKMSIKYAEDFLYNCAYSSMNTFNYPYEIEIMEYFINNYPQSSYYDDVKNKLINAYFTSPANQNSAELSSPSFSGYTYSNSVSLIIINSTPDSIRYVLKGPTSLIENVTPCKTCIKYFGTEPTYCPSGTEAKLEIEPGYYEVLVESISDNGVIPYKGKMNLRGGYEYTDCFYILTSQNP